MVNEYMSAEAAEAASPYASSAPEGSATWWTEEIAGREAAAIASTESTPGASTMTETYTDPRTGQMYPSKDWFLSENPAGVSVPVWQTPGVPVTTPEGDIYYTHKSQYWTETGYTGSEPSLAEKEAYSSAEYAAAFAGPLMSQYDQTAISPQAKAIATTYPKIATVPVTRTIAEQIKDLTGDTGLGDTLSQGIDWVKNNLLVIIIVISAVIILPRILPAPSRGR